MRSQLRRGAPRTTGGSRHAAEEPAREPNPISRGRTRSIQPKSFQRFRLGNISNLPRKYYRKREQEFDLDGATLIPEVGQGIGDFIVRNTLRFFAIASCSLNALTATAEPVQLTGETIKATLPGATLKLDTPLGMVVPIKFEGNGLMSGEAGQLASYLGSKRDRGRYWLHEDRVCYKWFRWFSGEQHCLLIQRDGQRIFWKRDDGETGTATLEEPPKAEPSVPVITAKPAKKYIAERKRPSAPVAPPMIGEPVLVKLPTLAVRPPKPAAVLAGDLPRPAAHTPPLEPIRRPR